MTEEEIDRAARFLGISPDEFIAEYARRIGARYTLKEVKRWDCVFLTDDGCRIYPARPVQCRTFPFWDENVQRRDYWDHAARDCPGMNSGKLYSCEEIDRLRDEKRR
jgi:Fe-S-cluster containining protein